MSARVDATASRVQSAVTTRKVTKSMEGVVKVNIWGFLSSVSPPPKCPISIARGWILFKLLFRVCLLL